MRILWRVLLGVIILAVVAFIGMHFWAANVRDREEQRLMALNKYIRVESRSFPASGTMPVNCTCKGAGRSPEISWSNVPLTATSFVVLATDYDVPTPAFPVYNLSHWVVYNISPEVRSLPEGVTAVQLTTLGGKIGANSMGEMAFVAPCPPVGRHAYVFRVYALDERLTFAKAPDKRTLLEAMEGHILGYGELTGFVQ